MPGNAEGFKTSAVWRAVWGDSQDSPSDDVFSSGDSKQGSFKGPFQGPRVELGDSGHSHDELTSVDSVPPRTEHSVDRGDTDRPVKGLQVKVKDENGNYPATTATDQSQGVQGVTPRPRPCRALIAKPVVPGFVYHTNKRKVMMRERPEAGAGGPRNNYMEGGGPTTATPQNAAHQAALAATLMTGSTSDSMVNNDFFYDDEFAVPFDANLAEGQDVSLLDSMELQDLLTGLGPHVQGDTSQSSDYNSSSDELSELRSEPLFSPTPCISSQEGISVSTDSLGGQVSLQTSNDQSYHFDWTANKDQYMISFDKSPRSDTDSLHDSSMVTSWANKSNDSTLKRQTTMATWSKQSGEAAKAAKQPLTTWGRIKLDSTPSPEPSAQVGGLTTWGRLKQDSIEKANDGKVRSKSLNDVCKDEGEGKTQRVFTRARSAGEAGMANSNSSGDCSPDLAVSSTVRESPTLYELYQKMRSGSIEGELTTAEGLQMLTGTWSMSPASSDQSLSPGPTLGNTPRLVSWSTIKDLARQLSNNSSQASSQGKVDAMVGSDQPMQMNNSRNQGLQANFPMNSSTLDAALKNILKSYPEIKELMERKKARIKTKKPEFIKSDLSSSVFNSLHLPDLSFLKSSRGLTQSLQVDPVTMSKGCQHVRPTERVRVKRGGSLDSRCPCRGSRETSPAIRRIRSSSSSSFCSSESGIDTGSYESSMRRTHSSDQGFSSQNSQSMSDIDSPRICVRPFQGSVCSDCHEECMALAQIKGQVCSVCEKTMIAVGHKAMASSLPGYLQHLDSKQPKDLQMFDLLQALPSYKVLQCRCEVASLNTRQLRNMEICVDQNDGKPLKSCLVKRQCKGKLLARARSSFDPYDLAVMKYSQEGQTRYQLITHHAECVHGLSRKGVNAKTATTTSLEDSSSQHRTDGRQHRPCCTMTPPNSPDLIPLMPCPCQSNNSCSSQSADNSPENSDHGDQAPQHRAKKSVSFSEEISYHSPYNSPHDSPKKQASRSVSSHDGSLGELICTCIVPPPTPGKPVAELLVSDDTLEIDLADAPPANFTVSPNPSPRPSPPPQGDAPPTPTDTTLPQKREMVTKVVKGAELIIAYFTTTNDHMQRMQMGDSSHSPDIGCLVLRKLCPAIYNLLQDGLKPHTTSLYGKVRNSVWGLVEESAQAGSCQPGCSMRVAGELVRDLHKLEFLSTNWLKFNAFIFALMNHKALDFWLSWLQGQESLLLKHYTAASFMVASRTATARHLFLDLTTALQPLAQLPFRLEYNFEFRLVQEQQHQRLVDQLLDKHVNSSLEDTLTLSAPTQPLVQETQTPSTLQLNSDESCAEDDDDVTPTGTADGVALLEDLLETAERALKAGTYAEKGITRPSTADATTNSIPDVVSTAEAQTKSNTASEVFEAAGGCKAASTFRRPEPPRRVYRKGVTDYQFNGSQDDVAAGNMSSDASRDSGIDEQHLDLGKLLSVKLREHAGRVDPRKRWSEGEAFKMAEQICADPPARKRWSTFVGPALVNLFDILVEDKQRNDQSMSSDSDGSQVLEPSPLFTQRFAPPAIPADVVIEKNAVSEPKQTASQELKAEGSGIKRSESRLPIARFVANRPSVPSKPSPTASKMPAAIQKPQVPITKPKVTGSARPTVVSKQVPSPVKQPALVSRSSNKAPVRNSSPVKSSANSSPVHKAKAVAAVVPSRVSQTSSPQQSRSQSPRNSPVHASPRNSPVKVKYPQPSRPPPPLPSKPKKSAAVVPEQKTQKVQSKVQSKVMVPPPKPARTMLSTEPAKAVKSADAPKIAKQEPLKKLTEPLRKTIEHVKKTVVEPLKPIVGHSITVNAQGLNATARKMVADVPSVVTSVVASVEDEDASRKSVRDLIKEIETKSTTESGIMLTSKAKSSTEEADVVVHSPTDLQLNITTTQAAPAPSDGPNLQCRKQKPVSRIPGLLTRHKLEAGRPRNPSTSAKSPESSESSLSGSSVSSQSSVIYNGLAH